MKASEMYPGKYLTQHDCEPPIQRVIRSVEKERMPMTNDVKWVMNFQPTDGKSDEEMQGLVLSPTKIDVLIAAFGDDMDNWPGKIIELYRDPTVEMNHKPVGGIKIRIPSGRPVVAGIGNVSWQAAVDEAAAAGLTVDALKTALKTRGITKASEITPKLMQEIIGARKAAAAQDFAAETGDDDSIPF